MIQKLLIANRGEIACRVIRTARELGMETVAIFSDADAGALHVKMADQAVRLGPAPASESYLKGEAIIQAALETGADAIHPGYGFLSENPEFVDAVETAGLTFIGPSAEAIRAMGLKDQAKTLMERAGVPVVPGYHGTRQESAFLAQEAEKIGYPVLVKARAGGGGKGMRLVEDKDGFADALASAAREAQASFGDPRCLIEKYIRSPRHIEVQVLGDCHGNIVHLFERDCSLQRRHQKVIEEAPAPGMSEGLRAAMGAAAVAAAKAVNYQGAGTVEFIVDGAAFPEPGCFWFMEMNTRLQVEHPVTELVTGLDLVALQIAVAEGRPLSFSQENLKLGGHAVEARLYAEDPGSGFLPATGKIRHFSQSALARVDTGVGAGDEISPHYDPMIAKIVVHGPDRPSAFGRLHRALCDTHISGLVTNRDFLARLARDPDVVAGKVDTGLIAQKGEALTNQPAPCNDVIAAAAIASLRAGSGPDPFDALSNFRLFGNARQSVLFVDHDPVLMTTSQDRLLIEVGSGRMSARDVAWNDDRLGVTLDGRRETFHVLQQEGVVLVDHGGSQHKFALVQPGEESAAETGNELCAPMTGRIVDVSANVGDVVSEGQSLIVLEAMKMEHRITAPRDGRVARLAAEAGLLVEQGAILIELEEETP